MTYFSVLLHLYVFCVTYNKTAVFVASAFDLAVVLNGVGIKRAAQNQEKNKETNK